MMVYLAFLFDLLDSDIGNIAMDKSTPVETTLG